MQKNQKIFGKIKYSCYTIRVGEYYMIYLDYSATTPVSKEVLDSYLKVTKEYIGNPNSLHSLGQKSH